MKFIAALTIVALLAFARAAPAQAPRPKDAPTIADVIAMLGAIQADIQAKSDAAAARAAALEARVKALEGAVVAPPAVAPAPDPAVPSMVIWHIHFLVSNPGQAPAVPSLPRARPAALPAARKVATTPSTPPARLSSRQEEIRRIVAEEFARSRRQSSIRTVPVRMAPPRPLAQPMFRMAGPASC